MSLKTIRYYRESNTFIFSKEVLTKDEYEGIVRPLLFDYLHHFDYQTTQDLLANHLTEPSQLFSPGSLVHQKQILCRANFENGEEVEIKLTINLKKKTLKATSSLSDSAVALELKVLDTHFQL